MARRRVADPVGLDTRLVLAEHLRDRIEVVAEHPPFVRPHDRLLALVETGEQVEVSYWQLPAELRLMVPGRPHVVIVEVDGTLTPSGAQR